MKENDTSLNHGLAGRNEENQNKRVNMWINKFLVSSKHTHTKRKKVHKKEKKKDYVS